MTNQQAIRQAYSITHRLLSDYLDAGYPELSECNDSEDDRGKVRVFLTDLRNKCFQCAEGLKR